MKRNHKEIAEEKLKKQKMQTEENLGNLGTGKIDNFAV